MRQHTFIRFACCVVWRGMSTCRHYIYLKWFVVFFIVLYFICRRFGTLCRHDKIQTPRESPQKEIIQHSQHGGESSKSENNLWSVLRTPLIRTNTLQIWRPWRHNTQLYYNPHVVLMAFQNVLCLNVTVRLPDSFLTSLCPSLFIPVSFHSSFLLFFISHFPYLLSLLFSLFLFLNLFLCFILPVLSCFPSLNQYLFPSFIPLYFHSLRCLCQVLS
jgi:hypothetical protein